MTSVKVLRFLVAVVLTPVTILLDLEFLSLLFTPKSSLTDCLWNWVAPSPVGTPIGDIIDRLSNKARVAIAAVVLLVIIGVFVALVIGKRSLMSH